MAFSVFYSDSVAQVREDYPSAREALAAARDFRASGARGVFVTDGQGHELPDVELELSQIRRPQMHKGPRGEKRDVIGGAIMLAKIATPEDENSGHALHRFVIGLLILGGLAAYLLLYEPNGLLGVGLLVFATLFQMFWPPLLARIAPGLPVQTKVPIWFFFFTIAVGVVAIWLLFANLLIVISVTAGWLLLFVTDH
jgi:hypothetical protein